MNFLKSVLFEEEEGKFQPISSEEHDKQEGTRQQDTQKPETQTPENAHPVLDAAAEEEEGRGEAGGNEREAEEGLGGAEGGGGGGGGEAGREGEGAEQAQQPLVGESMDEASRGSEGTPGVTDEAPAASRGVRKQVRDSAPRLCAERSSREYCCVLRFVSPCACGNAW